jgi:hypothetical protein
VYQVVHLRLTSFLEICAVGDQQVYNYSWYGFAVVLYGMLAMARSFGGVHQGRESHVAVLLLAECTHAEITLSGAPCMHRQFHCTCAPAALTSFLEVVT